MRLPVLDPILHAVLIQMATLVNKEFTSAMSAGKKLEGLVNRRNDEAALLVKVKNIVIKNQILFLFK